jgi:MFS family permease
MTGDGLTDRRGDGLEGGEQATAQPSNHRSVLPSIKPVARRAVFPALRHRNFRLYYVGFVVSLAGTWMQRVAQSWLVLELTDSAFYVGLVDALSMMPVLVFTLYAGVLADRFPKRRLVVMTQSGAMVLALTLTALVFANVVVLWHIVTIAALMGLAQAFDIPARHALMVELVGTEDLTNAIALNSSAFNATRVVAPAVAGALIATVGVGVCFLINGVSYIAVIVALLVIRLPPFRRPDSTASTWQHLRDGLHYVLSDVRSRTLVLNIATFSVFGLPTFVLMPVMARDMLGQGAEAYGWMMSAVGLGALAGALGLAVFGHRLRRGPLVTWAATAFGIMVVLFALSRSLALSLVILVVLGFVTFFTTALTNTLLQTIAPDALRGRVVSFYVWAFLGLGPFGALQAGAVAERIGTGNALALGGVICTIVAASMLLRSRHLRETA